MSSKLEELKGRLSKYRGEAIIISKICCDNSWSAKMLHININKLQSLLEKTEIISTNDDEIAKAIILSLKDMKKGKSATERGNILLTNVTSLMNESKDSIDDNDKIGAIVMMRSIAGKILPVDLYKPEEVKFFKPPILTDKQKLLNHIEKAEKYFSEGAVNSDASHKDEEACANELLQMLDTVKNAKTRADWLAEQIYGMNADILTIIKNSTDDDDLSASLIAEYAAHIIETEHKSKRKADRTNKKTENNSGRKYNTATDDIAIKRINEMTKVLHNANKSLLCKVAAM